MHAAVPRTPVASWRHTGVMLAIFALLAVAGATRGGAVATRSGSHVPLYLSLLAAEWGLVYYVWKRGLRPRGVALRDLVAARWRGPRDVARDVLLGLATWGVWTALARALAHALPSVDGTVVRSVVPTGAVEATLWIALAISAGFAEELVFRGYFQRQLAALTGHVWVGVALQALVFGVAHGYQGPAAVLRIAAYGTLFGALAWWRRSLAPGMIAHAWTDVAAGLLRV